VPPDVADDREYVSDLLAKERYLNALMTNIEIELNDARGRRIKPQWTPEEAREVVRAANRGLDSTYKVPELEQEFKSKIADTRLIRENYQRNPTEDNRRQVERAERDSAEIQDRLTRLKERIDRDRPNFERYFLENKREIAYVYDYLPVKVEPFGYTGATKEFYNFPSKREHDRFLQYAHFYAVSTQMKAIRKSLLSQYDAGYRKDLFDKELRSAAILYEQKDFSTARLYFEDITDAYGKYFKNVEDLNFYRAECAFGLGHYEEARALYDKVLAAYSGDEYTQEDHLKRLQTDVDKMKMQAKGQRDSLVSTKELYQRLLAASQTGNVDIRREGYSLNYINRQIEILDEDIDDLDKQTARVDAKYNQVRQEAGSRVIKSAVGSYFRSPSVYKTLLMDYITDNPKAFEADERRLEPFLNRPDIHIEKAKLVIGTMAVRTKQYEKAETVLKQVPPESEARADAEYVLGVNALEQQDLDKAAQYFAAVTNNTQMFWENKHDLIKSAAYLQLGHISYTRANRLMNEARRYYTGDEKDRAVSDSAMQIELRKFARSAQATIYDRQLAKILEQITSQDTVIERLNLALLSEVSSLAISEKELQRYAYSVQNKRMVLDNADQNLTRIQKELDEAQNEGRIASEQLARMRDRLSRLQRQALRARYDLYRRFAQAQYARAEEFFDDVAKSYTGNDVAKTGLAWSKYRQNRELEARNDIREFTRQYRSSDKMYQMMFLSGYMTHIKDPTDAEKIMKEYDFVYNGVMAFNYADKYFADRSEIRQQKMNTEALIFGSVDGGEIQAAQKLSAAQTAALTVLQIDKNTLRTPENTLLLAASKPALQQSLDAVKQVKAQSGGYARVAQSADKTQAALERLLSTSMQTITPEEKVWTKHAPVLVSEKDVDDNRNMPYYRNAAQVEALRANKQLEILDRAATQGDSRRVLVNEFFKDNALRQRNESNAVDVQVAKNEAYGGRSVERAGSTAQYALASMIYNEIQKNRAQEKVYGSVLGTFKNAIRKKINQLEFYMSQIDKESISDGTVIFTAGDEKQKEFNDIFNDFRRSFFQGTEFLKNRKTLDEKK
jgi:hypothetical protein